jgi:hypothetical protein
MPSERRPSERRLTKRSVAKDGNKAKRARKGGKAGSKAVDSVTEEGRVLPTEAATVSVPEMAEAEKEGTDKEGSLAAETAAATAAETDAVEKEKEASLASETDAVEKEVEAGTVEEGEGHDIAYVSAETESVDKEGEELVEAGTVEEGGEEESVEEASLGDKEDDCDDGSQGVPQEGVVAPVLINMAVAAFQPSQDMSPSSAVTFRIFKNFVKVDLNLIVGNNEQEWFADIYRMAQMSKLDREAELAKCHDALKARQDMKKLQQQQRQVDHMRASVAEQMKRREVEALQSSNQVSFLV